MKLKRFFIFILIFCACFTAGYYNTYAYDFWHSGLNTYPVANNSNYITKGIRGDERYYMESHKRVLDNGYATEIDIDINMSYDWSNNGSIYCMDVQNVFTY